MSLEISAQSIPEEWLIEAESVFFRMKSNSNFLTKGEFHQFLTEFLKSCPQEMTDTKSPIENFFQRFSSNQNETFTLNDFKKVFTELCLVKIDFTEDN